MGSLQPLGMAPQTGQRSWHLSLLLPIMASFGTLQWYGCILGLSCGMAVSHRPISLGSTAVARPRSPCLCSTTTPSRLTSILRGDSPYLGSPPLLVLFSAVLFQVAFNFRDVRTCAVLSLFFVFPGIGHFGGIPYGPYLVRP